MDRSARVAVVLMCLVLIAAGGSARAQDYATTVVSGTAPVGRHFINNTTSFTAMTPAIFANARTAAQGQAVVITPNAAWGNIGGSPAPQWIGTAPNAGTVAGASCVYAVPLLVPVEIPLRKGTKATLTIDVMVDNVVGSGTAQSGVYFGYGTQTPTGLPGTSGIAGFGANTNLVVDVSQTVQSAGTYWLYFWAHNLSTNNPAGLQFRATLAIANRSMCETQLEQATIAFGTAASDIVGSDLNFDGRPDFVVAFNNAGTVNAYRNNGDGTFTGTPVVSGPSTNRVLAAQLVGSPMPDIVVANYNSSSLSVIENTTPFTLTNQPLQFGAVTTLACGANPTDPVVADFNNDGRLDIAVANLQASTISVFMNTGSGFAAGVTHPTGTNPARLWAVDVDNSGYVDLVARSPGQGTMVVHLNGPGGFSAGTPVTVPAGQRDAVGDFNGDGLCDFLVYTNNAGGANLYTRRTDGGYNAAQPLTLATNGIPAAAELNDDGVADLAFGQLGTASLKVQHSKTDGFYPDFTLGATVNSVAVTTGDHLHDGRDGFAVVTNVFGSNATAYTNLGTLRFAMPTTLSGPVSQFGESFAGNITGDSRAEVLSIFNTTAYVYGLGAGGSPVLLFSQSIQPWTAAATGDLDGDGRLDLVTLNAGNTVVSVYVNSGGAYPNRTDLALTGLGSGLDPGQLHIADINRDGRPDVIAVGPSGFKVFLNTWPGPFFPQPTVPLSGTIRSTLSDLNGDGAPEFFAMVSPTLMARLDNDTLGAFAAPVNTVMPRPVVDLLGGDLNGDGYGELVLVESSSARIRLRTLRNDTAGVLTPTSDFYLPQWHGTPPRLALADLDGDRRADLIVGARGPALGLRALHVYRNAGNARFGSRQSLWTLGELAYAAVGDFNGDGRPDLTAVKQSELLMLLNASTSATIASQPVNASVCQGGTGQFAVAMGGSGTFTYQWQRLNSNVWSPLREGANVGLGNATGTTSATLQITPSVGAPATAVRCLVRWECGYEESSSAVVTATAVSCACNAADIATAGSGNPQSGPDGFLTGDDFDLFINAFFNEVRRTSDNSLIADLVDGNGNPPRDGFLTGSDFDYFLARFFEGC